MAFSGGFAEMKRGFKRIIRPHLHIQLVFTAVFGEGWEDGRFVGKRVACFLEISC